MSLHFQATLAERHFDVSLELAPGETVAVMGPNGAGKSTIVEIIAGITRPDACRVVVDDTDVSRMPTHRRKVGLLAQDPLLLPHLSVRDNVAFGPRSTGANKAGSRAIADDWLGRIDLSALTNRRPSSLSGGQAQRVAIARALATSPSVVMLDEPMAALDVTAVPDVRALLREVLAERTAIVITHDVLDALTLADRVIVLESGRVAESGPTADLLARPRSAFGASIAGLNLIRGTYDDHAVRGDPNFVGLSVVGEASEAIDQGASAVAVFSPAAVSVHLDRPSGSPRNTWATTVRSLEPLGDRIRVRTDVVAADVTTAAVAELGLAPERKVFLAVKATEVAIHPS